MFLFGKITTPYSGCTVYPDWTGDKPVDRNKTPRNAGRLQFFDARQRRSGERIIQHNGVITVRTGRNDGEMATGKLFHRA